MQKHGNIYLDSSTENVHWSVKQLASHGASTREEQVCILHKSDLTKRVQQDLLKYM